MKQLKTNNLLEKVTKIAIEVLIFSLIFFLYSYFFENKAFESSYIEALLVGFVAGISIYFFNKFMDNKKKSENAENN